LKAYKLEVLILDHDEVGAKDIVEILENTSFPNHCINPQVKSITEADIGELTDDHPLNKRDTMEAEYRRLFNHL
jgi:hypothetical protein